MIQEIVKQKKAKYKAVQYDISTIEKSNRSFKELLRGRKRLSLIAELKKASPSKGLLDEQFDHISIARQYEEAGATCLSVLTEEDFFIGSLDIMKEVSAIVTLPILRKDFIFDASQVLEARMYGADAVLLIAAILDDATLKLCQENAQKLGMDVLVEVHTIAELERVLALNEANLVVGINNRNLEDMKIDQNNFLSLMKYVPDEYVLVAESGYRTKEDLLEIEGKADAVLIGTSLMQVGDKISKIKSLFNPIIV